MVGLLEKMNGVIDYIENNLNGEIEIKEIARISHYSSAAFQRMFSIICDLSLSEYIRRRRLTLAAFELQNNAGKITDLSAKYGYESPEAFTRAFRAIHGVSPTAARRVGTPLQAYPRISFHLTLKGSAPLNYRIEQKGAFSVYGVERVISVANGEDWAAVPNFWNEAVLNGGLDKLIQSTNKPSTGEGLNLINSIECYRDTGGDTIPYMICAIKTDESDTDGYTVVDVPPSLWVIFKSGIHALEETSAAISGLIQRIYTDWLPTAGYVKLDGFEFEMTYKHGDKFYSEKWMRVKPI